MLIQINFLSISFNFNKETATTIPLAIVGTAITIKREIKERN